ncbi:MAG TPA: oxygen-dependent coproporphyrinogen oxidase [Anaeromyxobacteraceae bacterium]|nr:oxygen-dependent coproporphyrinogen oxidase [Anaeromyxobacteraceae bacterium]
MPHEALRAAMADLVRELQEDLCPELERLDGTGRFSREAWERPGGGGGLTRVLEGGALLEKAGVNVSEVHGDLDPAFAGALGGEGTGFAAVGLSVVLHPLSPMVPTAHMNVRMVARGEKAWFGGGADLTPYYLFDEDAAHFHRTLKAACDRHDPAWYPRFKKACDDYFFLPHRGERRGVGGLFFEDPDPDLSRGLALCGDVARAFPAAWTPIAARRRALPFGDRERTWQEIRRGRYVEFNLLHDRGTVFGLRTGGRVESILMSLPPRVRWTYDHRPERGSAEARLLEVLRSPRDWA